MNMQATLARAALGTALLLCLPNASEAQTTAARNTVRFPHYTQALGKLDRDGFPTSGATIRVLGHPSEAFSMPSQTTAETDEATYDFGLDPRSERLPLRTSGSWVFLAATFFAGGSGTQERLAVLRYEPSGTGGKIVNLLPPVGITELSERAMWTVPAASAYPILADASFIWGEGESHFEPHFYTVEVWRYDVTRDRYVRAFSYRTRKKYGGEEPGPGAVSALSAERPAILRRLRTLPTSDKKK